MGYKKRILEREIKKKILLRSGTAMSLGVEVGVVIFPGGGVEAGAIRDFLGSVSLVLRHS